MTNLIQLPTRNGTRTAELFAVFNADIAGVSFEFAVHRHLACGNHIKVSEFATGMGIAEIAFPGPLESPSFEGMDLAEQGQHAVAHLVSTRGAAAVAQTLTTNRLAAQILNDRGQLH